MPNHSADRSILIFLTAALRITAIGNFVANPTALAGLMIGFASIQFTVLMVPK